MKGTALLESVLVIEALVNKIMLIFQDDRLEDSEWFQLLSFQSTCDNKSFLTALEDQFRADCTYLNQLLKEKITNDDSEYEPTIFSCFQRLQLRLILLGILASLYHSYQTKSTTPYHTEDFMRRYQPGNKDSLFPSYMVFTFCHVGSPLASLIYAAAEIFEKGIQFQDSLNSEEIIMFPRNYYFANILYEYLLLSPYMEHRRGRWYKRLAINYDHLKLSELVVLSLLRGLQDSNTQVGCLHMQYLCYRIKLFFA